MTITVPAGLVSWGWKNAMVACRELYTEDYGVMSPILPDTCVAMHKQTHTHTHTHTQVKFE